MDIQRYAGVGGQMDMTLNSTQKCNEATALGVWHRVDIATRPQKRQERKKAGAQNKMI